MEWFQLFPNANLWHLPRITSDHCPVLLKLQNEAFVQGEKPFRFEPMWLLDHRFRESALPKWPSPSRSIQESLNAFRETLIDWNQTTFGNVYRRKRRLVARLKGTQMYLQDHPSSPFHQIMETLQQEIMETLDQEETLWKSKCRMERIGEGERNTRYFHRTVLIKRNTSRINSLRRLSEALRLAVANSLPKAIIYSDCQDAINLLKGGHSDLYSNMIIMCRQWLTQRPDLQIKHCSRKFNQVADKMAKACRNMIGDSAVTRLFPSPPGYCIEQLLLDCNMFNIIS